VAQGTVLSNEQDLKKFAKGEKDTLSGKGHLKWQYMYVVLHTSSTYLEVWIIFRFPLFCRHFTKATRGSYDHSDQKMVSKYDTSYLIQ
jgi:hypothetical protein